MKHKYGKYIIKTSDIGETKINGKYRNNASTIEEVKNTVSIGIR